MSLTTTTFLLMAQYNAPIIPLEDICEPYLAVSFDRAKRKAARGELGLPVFTLGDSRKSPPMVHIEDLAALIDQRQAEARADHQRVNSSGVSLPV